MNYKPGDSDKRPWGTWQVLDVGAKYAVKRLVINPGEKFSLQKHHHRDEYWVVVSGTATITAGADVLEKKENESIFIPRGTVHRIANNAKIPVVVIEVQTGDDLREDDIVRLEDAYGRV